MKRGAAFLLGSILLLCPAPPASPADAPLPFEGETLTYAMSWGPFAGGVMTITSSTPVAFAGHTAYRIELSAISNDFISNFFVVRDSIISWIDARTLESLRYEKHTVEGKRVDDERIDFDHQEKVARRGTRVIPFAPPVFDSLSAVYYLRALALPPPEPIELEVVSGKHAYRLEVDVEGLEMVKTPAGLFHARKVHPKMKGEGLLRKQADLWLWFTDDERRVPVMIRSKLNFGTLTAKLVRRSIAEASPPDERKGEPGVINFRQRGPRWR